MEKEKQFSAKQVILAIVITVLLTVILIFLGGAGVYKILQPNNMVADKPISATPSNTSDFASTIAPPTIAPATPTDVILTPSPTSTTLDSTTPMLPLPQAITATVPAKAPEDWVLSDDQATNLATSKTANLGDKIPVVIRRVYFTENFINLVGKIDYSIYQGEITMSGTPSVKSMRLRITLTSVTVDGQPLPRALYPTIEEMISSIFDNNLFWGLDVIDAKAELGFLALKVIKK